MRVYVNTHKPSPCALPGQLSGRRTRRLNVTALGYLAVGQRVALGKVPVALWSRGGAEGEETPPRRCHHLPPNPRTFPKFYFHLISGAGSSALEEGAPGLLPWVPGSVPAHPPHEDGGNSGWPGTAGGWAGSVPWAPEPLQKPNQDSERPELGRRSQTPALLRRDASPSFPPAELTPRFRDENCWRSRCRGSGGRTPSAGEFLLEYLFRSK